MEAISLEPVWLSLKLAAVTTAFLLVLATPLAWWLARTKSAWRAPISAIVTLPLVLSPQFFGWLFGLEDNVELIAPQKAAEEYRRKLKAVLEQYG